MTKTFFQIILPTLLITLLAYYLQSHIFLSGDVGYLMYLAKLMAQGGNYGKDFFETNPPMILYLSLPPWLIAKLFTIDIILAMRIYLFSLIIISASLSCLLLSRIIKPGHRVVFLAMYYTLLYVLLFLPSYHVGQREHLLLIFIMPYVFSSVLALEKKPANKAVAVFIGLFAGLGFAIKPYFLAPLILIELYFIYRTKSLWGWVRIETLMILTVLILYLASVFIYYPDYLRLILPAVSQFYFIGIKTPWLYIFIQPLVIFCFIGVIFYFLFRKDNDYPVLSTVIMLTLLGLIIAFLLTQTTWLYHILPALGLSFLLISFYLGTMLLSYLNSKNSLLSALQGMSILAIACIVICSLPVYQSYRSYKAALEETRDSPLRSLITYINSLPDNRSIVCFSVDTTEDCFPLIYETNSTYGSRYPFYWWVRGVLVREGYPNKVRTMPAAYLKSEKYLIENAAADLTKDTRTWVILNTKDTYIAIGAYFNLLSYLSKNAEFRHAWKNYTHVKTIGYYQVYKRQEGNT